MIVCYFGIYDQNYSRNKILINGLIENGVEVIECHTDKKGVKKYLYLISNFLKIRNKFNVMVVGYPGFQAVILAKILTRQPIIFDAFLSLYDSLIHDRKTVKPKSLKALYYWFLDYSSAKLADIILLDTEEHIDYFSKTFNIKRDKFRKIWIGADDKIFYPRTWKGQNNNFLVHFHGTFIPLQGIKYIIDAAKLLKNEKITFNFLGNGQEYQKIKTSIESEGLHNIKLLGMMPINLVAENIAKSDICLGIFGDTDKAKRVIPNKVYECIAMKKPVITAGTKAMREIFTNNDVLFSNIADAQDVADKIKNLINDKELRNKLANNSYNLYLKNFTPKSLGFELLKIIKKIYAEE